MGTIFVAGAYGVGKTTTCQGLASLLRIPSFSAGDLISKVNGESYGANKVVKDKNNNQQILESEVSHLLNSYDRILLAGHFCIFDKDNRVDILPISVFLRLHIELILLLETSGEVIKQNLKTRDGRDYPREKIQQLLETERLMSEKVTEMIQCPLIIHKMSFDETDVQSCYDAIGKQGEIRKGG